MEFLTIKKEDLEMILRWRKSEFVTRYMFTDIEGDMKQQERWYRNLQKDRNSMYWIVASKGKKLGLVSLNDIHWSHKHASWAFYIGEPKYSMIAGMIGPHLYNYAFYELGLLKLTGEVMEGNDAVRKMHQSHGCREVGCLKKHIYKYGTFHDVYIYEMLADEWEMKQERFKKLFPKVEQISPN
ncbi:UDP-4-amino-4,6-dideoxy-N-acetyl-beta-L-altrosamine N-acetyltransferase [Halalkalibacter hemicellulosilyticus]|uniref:Flagellin modification protein FlmH n=1 Tax=Halalkalibacter hemicellulosilyticusJCM 9152 TaxID=1236971 RepID=W4QJQ6_9BACI|nr:UDP-4-amino-4,6-dideoxy-N-acetyl-beta-L-altrosamine N-acetyltransferase [Halalkalibacter hemicellulosilyticus]GAE32147.1 flagellin modification protein FlmH [Halalkalibacter hemicellulosilyticusJCM 9152]